MSARRRTWLASAAALAVVLSAAALPGSDAQPARAAELRAELARLVESAGWGNDLWGVLVFSLDHGDTLFSVNATRALVPASNMKLFTSAAALRYLGPGYRYGTYLISDGLVENDVLRGDLVIYGTGDPAISGRFLASPNAVWEAFADSLLALGVRQVAGDLVGDGSYFGPATAPEGWQTSYMNAAYAALADGLAFNDNAVSLRIRPSSPGERPDIDYIPGGEGIALVNLATTTGGGTTRLRIDRVGYDGPILVEGTIRQGQPAVWRQVPVADPPRFAAAAFRDVLRRRGIEVHGALRSVTHPEDSRLGDRSTFAPRFDDRPPLRVLATHSSPPLLEILKVINQRSHNMYAEQVLRTLGRVVDGDGTTEAGARVVARFMEEEVGWSGEELRVVDGSGLSRLNRSSAAAIVALLGYMADSSMWTWYWETLPEAGVSPRLRRMGQTPAEGNLRAKTGTIEHVSALSGYVRAANGERIAFSILSNEVPSTWRAKRVEDGIGALLAGMERPVPPRGTGSLAGAGREREPAAPPPDDILAPPDAEAPSAGPRAASEPAHPATHTIRSGDTLEGIARRYGMTVRELEAVNPGLDPRRLIPGRTVRLPGGAAEPQS